jgi:hypothetical protein
MSQKIHLITYGDNKFARSKQRLNNEAINSNWFHNVTIYGPEDLKEDFKNEFNDILKQPRGGGYWIWKFDIIKQQLTKINKNDILIYLDAGCSININGKKRFYEYIEMLNNSDKGIISFQLPHLEICYTIKELLQHFDIDEPKQFMATILIMKNTEKMMKIIDECINILRKDHLLVTDHYNKIGQCKEFKDNRHDQSILSLVRKKYGSIILKDETWFTPFGNAKSQEFPFWATRKK